MTRLSSKKILITCGSGGVGKTTLAASIALQAALDGKKVIVLTIDPARRLAQALGLKELSNEPTLVKRFPPPPPTLHPPPLPPFGGISPDKRGSPPQREEDQRKGGFLMAMMLDTKRTFDRIIEKYARSPSEARSILDNRLYQHMSGMIAGSQEYMAMEKLYELHERNEYDLIVIDTPPTRHALDFLNSPKKMQGLTQNRLLKWFLMPGLFAGRVGWGLFEKGAERILSVFDRLAGFSFLHELAQMVSLVGGLIGGFHLRSEAVEDLLKDDKVGFLLVTSTASTALQDALYFHKRIKETGLPFLGFIINRVVQEAEPPPAKKLNSVTLELRQKILQSIERHHQLALRDQESIRFLRKMGGAGPLYLTVPLFAEDVHDLKGLQRIAPFLIS